ncbi:MAG: FAD-dependent monooxygenase [Vicinamibacterales bacterium]
MTSISRPIVIAGAGIGGLTLAIALQRHGIPVRVLERASVLAPAGAGLALQPNAMAIMASLGLAESVTAAGRPVARAAMLDQRGVALGAEQDMAALAAPFGAPVVALHRARLHAVLLQAIAPGTLSLAVEVIGYDASATGVTVRCADGATIETDLLVGADGLRSRVRQIVVGDGEPRYSGYTSWRGVTATDAGPRLARMSESWGRGERFGMVDIGHGEIYWFAVANAPPGGRDPDVRRELVTRFAGWHSPIRAVLDATPVDRILRTDIADRDPVTRWHAGRAVLMGDAAHPMTPNLGQGACQAIEDAAVLADALAEGSTVDASIDRYEAQRVGRANAVVIAARRFGAVAQWSNPAAAWIRNAALRMVPDRITHQQVRALWRAPARPGDAVRGTSGA